MIRCQHRGQCTEFEKCINNYCSIPPGNHLCDLHIDLAKFNRTKPIDMFEIQEDHVLKIYTVAKRVNAKRANVSKVVKTILTA